MKQVPIIRITDMLATRYALLARTVAAHACAPQVAGLCYRVVDDEGRCWQLHAEDEAGAQSVVFGTESGLVRHPGRGGTYQVRMAGLRWTVFAVRRSASPVVTSAWSLDQDRQGTVSRVVAAEDSAVLERVGAWLAQPAGLPPAQDASGAAFVEQWQAALPAITAWHARTEALHDAMVVTRGVPPATAVTQWEACCWQLHELVELQQRLLAVNVPQHAPQRDLERLAHVLASLPLSAGASVRRAQAG